MFHKIRPLQRIYQQITDIFAECSIDYDRNSQTTKEFYATVQNKFHFAITGKTAAEIIYKSADTSKPNMGQAKEKASKEYEAFNKIQKIESDFDKEMKKFLSQKHTTRNE